MISRLHLRGMAQINLVSVGTARTMMSIVAQATISFDRNQTDPRTTKISGRSSAAGLSNKTRQQTSGRVCRGPHTNHLARRQRSAQARVGPEVSEER